jgi:hypothetical protein
LRLSGFARLFPFFFSSSRKDAEAQRKNCKKSNLHPQFSKQLLKSLVLVGKANTSPFHHSLEGT